MAGFDTHLKGGIVAGLVGGGVAVGVGGVPIELLPPLVAAAGIGGILPDIDESNSIPARIVATLIAGVVGVAGVVVGLRWPPPFLPHWVAGVGGGVISFYGALFLLSLLQQFVRHRGVFHSIPMGVVLGLWTGIGVHYLGGVRWREGLLIGGFLFLGFATHLLIDEVASIHLRERRVKRSFGTAFKFWAPSPAVTSLLYLVLLGTILFLTLQPKG